MKEILKFYYKIRWSALRVPGGNQVDGLPPARHTETVAKPGRLGPAQNDEPMQNFIELTMFCIIFWEKSPRISCPEYIKDLDKCDKMWKWQCQGQIHDIPKIFDFRKNKKFPENIEKNRNFEIFQSLKYHGYGRGIVSSTF